MRKLAVLILPLLLSACGLAQSETVSFSAKVGGKPYRIQGAPRCMLNRFNADESPQWLISVDPAEADGALHVGLDASSDQPGTRRVTFVLLNHGDASFSDIRAAKASLDGIEKTATGFRINGRFELTLAGSSMTGGHPEIREIHIEAARFSHLDCLVSEDLKSGAH